MVRLSETELNDFIKPSAVCIKPITTFQKNLNAESKFGLHVEKEDENASTVRFSKVNLNDCLACSGCVTSAETVLVEQQSLDHVKRALKSIINLKKTKTCPLTIISICPQSRASFAAIWNISPSEAQTRLVKFLRRKGFDLVIDTNYARSISLKLAEEEFIQSYKKSHISKKEADSDYSEPKITHFEHDPLRLPILASSCPGWICFAEKLHHNILGNISKIRSPQQVIGLLIKRLIEVNENIDKSSIIHVSIMPCYDKKLEASRPEFACDSVRDVDFVLSSREILDWIHSENINLQDLDSLNFEFCDIQTTPQYLKQLAFPVQEHFGSSSGGYAWHILTSAARKLFGIEELVEGVNLITRPNVNNDLITFVLHDENGLPLLQVATCYGFRNLQNLVRRWQPINMNYKSKRDKHDLGSFDWIEVMACPSGCINGGGQINYTDAINVGDVSITKPRDWIALMKDRYDSSPKTIAVLNDDLTHLIEKLGGISQFTTSYHPVSEKMNMLQLASVW